MFLPVRLYSYPALAVINNGRDHAAEMPQLTNVSNAHPVKLIVSRKDARALPCISLYDIRIAAKGSIFLSSSSRGTRDIRDNSRHSRTAQQIPPPLIKMTKITSNGRGLAQPTCLPK